MGGCTDISSGSCCGSPSCGGAVMDANRYETWNIDDTTIRFDYEDGYTEVIYSDVAISIAPKDVAKIADALHRINNIVND